MSKDVAKMLSSLDVKAGMETPAVKAVRDDAAERPAQKARTPKKKPVQRRKASAPTAAPTLDPAPPAPRGRGRPPRHEEPVQQTTIRLTMDEWEALQMQVLRETRQSGERRYVVDIIRDAVQEYLERHK